MSIASDYLDGIITDDLERRYRYQQWHYWLKELPDKNWELIIGRHVMGPLESGETEMLLVTDYISHTALLREDSDVFLGLQIEAMCWALDWEEQEALGLNG